MAENAVQATRRQLLRVCYYAGPCRRNHVAVVILVRYSFHRRRGAQQDNDEEAPEWGHKDRFQSAFWVGARFPILLNLGSGFTRISRNE